MLTRRTFHIAIVSFGAASLSQRAIGQQGDTVTVRMRVDESVRAAIPPLPTMPTTRSGGRRPKSAKARNRGLGT